MSYNKDIDNYNKGEGHGADKSPKPDSKYLKTLLQLLIVGLILFCIYNYRADISKYFNEIKVKAENTLNSLNNSRETDESFIADKVEVEAKFDDELATMQTDDEIEPDEEGLVGEFPIKESVQENPKIMDTPPSLVPNEEVTSTKIVKLEIFEGRDGKEGLRDEKTQKVYLEPIYDRIGSIRNKNLSLWTVRLGKKYGWLAGDGSTIVPIEYDEISYLIEYGSTNHNPHLIVRKGNKQGIIDLYSRKIVLPLEYTNIKGTGTIKNKEGKLVSEYYVLSNQKGTGIYSITNKRLVIPLEYSSVSLANAGGFLVQKGQLYGAVDQQNEIIAPVKYNRLPIWSDYKDMITFKIAEEAFECYDSKGYRVMPPADKRKLNGANIGVAVFNGTDKKQGVQTSNGYIQIAAQYDYVFPVKTQTAILYIVSLNGKYGVVDKNNTPKIALSCDYISALNSEYDNNKGSKIMTHLRVYKNQKCGLITLSDMKTIIPIEYQNIGLATNDFMWVKQNDKYGLMNGKNKILLSINNLWSPKIELGLSEDKCAIRMLEGEYKNYVFYNSKGDKIDRPY